jgi:hypothetical protein
MLKSYRSLKHMDLWIQKGYNKEKSTAKWNADNFILDKPNYGFKSWSAKF